MGELWLQLHNWRQNLPSFMQWTDSDPPAQDVSHARIRKDYYRTACAITRPFLFHAIHHQDPQILSARLLKKAMEENVTKNLDELFTQKAGSQDDLL